LNPPKPYSVTIFYWAQEELKRVTTDTFFGGNKAVYFKADYLGGYYDVYTGAVNLGNWLFGYRESNRLLKLRNFTAQEYVGGLPLNSFNDYFLEERVLNSSLNTGNIEFVLPPLDPRIR
jgi:hypothetical protein